jgi:hypothetical protein
VGEADGLRDRRHGLSRFAPPRTGRTVFRIQLSEGHSSHAPARNCETVQQENHAVGLLL